MYSKIIGVSGKIGSGKTTFCSFVQEYLLSLKNKCELKGFADKLKDVAFILTGKRVKTQEDKNIFIPEFQMTLGQILQKLGTETMRDHFDQDVWIKALLSNIDENEFTIIHDVRFENEAKAIKEKKGLLIRLEGDPVAVRKNSTRDLTHSSETSLDDYEGFHEVYQNDKSLEDLKLFAKKIIDNYYF